MSKRFCGDDSCVLVDALGGTLPKDLLMAARGMARNSGSPLCVALVDTGALRARDALPIVSGECALAKNKAQAAIAWAAIARRIIGVVTLQAIDLRNKL